MTTGRAAGLLCFLVLGLACATAGLPAPTGPPDWASVSEERFLLVWTHDPDGDARRTRVVFVVRDGVGVVRTGETRWFGNLVREPRARVEVGGAVYAVRAELLEDAEEEARIDAAFREKYGLADRLADWIRPTERRVLRLLPAVEGGTSGGSQERQDAAVPDYRSLRLHQARLSSFSSPGLGKEPARPSWSCA